MVTLKFIRIGTLWSAEVSLQTGMKLWMLFLLVPQSRFQLILSFPKIAQVNRMS